MKQVNCPNCGASMEFDDGREFAFCMYCGTKIILNDKVLINRNDEINNLLNRAYEYEKRNDYIKARDYCNRVLDIDSKNEYARALEERLAHAAPINNVVIKYISSLDARYKLRVTLDGFTWYTVEPNEQISLKLPLGNHNVLLAGKKTYTKRISVTDTKKVIKITYNRNTNDIYIE